MMGYATPEDLISDIGDIAGAIYVHPEARAEYERLMQRDGMVREYRVPGSHPQRIGAVALRQRQRRAQRGRQVMSATRERCATSPTRSGPRMRSPKAAACCNMVIDTVPAVINVKDKELRYVLMNRYMAGIFGVEPRDAIGRTTADLMSRYGAEKTDENDKRVLASARDSASTRRNTWMPPAICGNGWSTSCRCSMRPARSRTSSPLRSTSASASAAN